MDGLTRADLAVVTDDPYTHEPTPPGPDDPTDEPDELPARPAALNTPTPASLPALVITFEGVGMAGASVTFDPRTTIGQMMSAAFLLDCLAREMRQGQLVQAARSQLVVPAAGGLPAATIPRDLLRRS